MILKKRMCQDHEYVCDHIAARRRHRPEIVAEAVKVLDAAGRLFDFRCAYTDALLGGCAIDATGKPLPEETVEACLASDAVLLGAVGGYKWDTLPGGQRPEAGLLGIRAALGLFANLRPAKIYGPLKARVPCGKILSETVWMLWWCGN